MEEGESDADEQASKLLSALQELQQAIQEALDKFFIWNPHKQMYSFRPERMLTQEILRGGSVDGRKTFSGKKCPVKRNTFGGKEPIN